jgi:murein tripeptide amidase MpaA
MKREAAFIITGLALITALVGAGAAEERREAPARPPAAQADWTTPAEAGGFRTTPRYDETMAYLRRVAAAAPRKVRIETFGRTGEGRDLVAVVVSKDGLSEPAAARRAGRPVVLIQNAIHAGEMDGKDACLMLLRDLVVTGEKAALLDRAVVVIIPIYNADGHERFGPHNRINQNGPEEMGWRTQARNLNLNRDYMKADAPETRAFLRLWNRWTCSSTRTSPTGRTTSTTPPTASTPGRRSSRRRRSGASRSCRPTWSPRSPPRARSSAPSSP